MENKNNGSPCGSCTRVKDPENCENKYCRVWRAWFAETWENTRMMPSLQRLAKHEDNLPTVKIGGRAYALPDRVREYMQKDPCDKCPMPHEYCYSECSEKRLWLELQEKEEQPDELER